MTETHEAVWSPGQAVVSAIAEREGVDPTALPPLYETVDPDALDALCRRSGDGTDVTVRFSYLGYEVAVRSADGVAIREEPVAAGD